VNAATAAEFSDAAEYTTDVIRRDTNEPQLGILSLAARLEAEGWSPRIFDLNRTFFRYAEADGEAALENFAELAAQQIGAIQADVYGFGSICSAYPLALRIARLVKLECPESTIVFGGPQASVVAEQTLASFSFVDFVVRGEAEESLPILLNELFGSRRFDLVPGLTHRSAFGIQRNVDAPLILDLDALPSPAYHLTGELHGQVRASLELGRGCPFSCTFCSTNDFFRRRFRLRSPERVLQDMRAIDAEYGIRDFDLVHDMFTVDRKRVVAFCQALLDSREGYTWSCSARTDCVDEELIELMAAAGCTGMFFGVETGSERMQKVIDKHLDTRRAHQIIDIVERAGIRSTVSLITGFPQETLADLRETVSMFMHSARTPESSPQLNLLAPLANTPLHIQFNDQMTLDLLCSDMSHQGRKQHPEDMELIRRHPDIFPNFYLLPTPALERAMLLELREFTLMAELRFRWLLGAVDQATTGILDVFLEWLERRKLLYPGLAGSELRHYYRTRLFVRDFVGFLRAHPSGANEVVKLFLEYEDAMANAAPPSDMPSSPTIEVRYGETLDWSDLPIRQGRSRVLELSRGLEDGIQSVKQSCQPDWKRGPQHYVVKQAAGKENPVYHVSPGIAKLVHACDGRRAICDVLEHLSAEFGPIPESKRDYEFMKLLDKSWAEGLISIFRSASDAAPSQDGDDSMREYAEISAAASLRNQASIQAI